MRILFLDQFSAFGGAQLCLRDMLSEVRRRGWEAEVMAPGNGPLLAFARDCGFDAHTVPMAEYSSSCKAASDWVGFGLGMARSAWMVRRALRERPADLIYVNGPRVLPAAIQREAPVIFHAHSVVSMGWARAVAGWSLRRARAMALACSEFAARPVEAAIGRRVPVIYNGVADCGFRPRVTGRGPIRVGLLGRIAPEKGHLDFINAARRLSGNPNLRFCVIGEALFSTANMSAPCAHSASLPESSFAAGPMTWRACSTSLTFWPCPRRAGGEHAGGDGGDVRRHVRDR